MIAIQTRYLCPTNFRGARIVAEAHKRTESYAGLKVTIPWPDNADRAEDAHFEAAKALCVRMGWGGAVVGGCLGSGDYAWCFVEREDGKPIEGALRELPEPKREG